MSTTDQIQAAVEHLATALSLLDQIGADVTAAHVDGAIECLKAELRGISWEDALAADYSHLDALIDDTYGKQRSRARLIAFDGE